MEPVKCKYCAGVAADKVAAKTGTEAVQWVELITLLLPVILNCFQGGYSDLKDISWWDKVKLNLAVRREARNNGTRLRRKEAVAIADSIVETAGEIEEDTFNAMMIEAEIL